MEKESQSEHATGEAPGPEEPSTTLEVNSSAPEVNTSLQSSVPEAELDEVAKASGEDPPAEPQAEESQGAPAAAAASPPPPAHEKDQAKTESKPLGKAQNKRRQKKDPNAPHRPLSAYNLFFRDTRKKLKPTPEAKIGFETLVKTVSARWKVVSPEEKAKYEKLAKEDNARYYNELKAYHERGDVQTAMAKSNRKRRKILGVAKRPLSGYNIFFSEEHARLKQLIAEGKCEGFPNVTVEIARRWAELSKEQKQELQERAEEHRRKQREKEQSDNRVYGQGLGLMQSMPMHGMAPGLAGRLFPGFPIPAANMHDAFQKQLMALGMQAAPGQPPFAPAANPFFQMPPPPNGVFTGRGGTAPGTQPPQGVPPPMMDFNSVRPVVDPRVLLGLGDQDMFVDQRNAHEFLTAMVPPQPVVSGPSHVEHQLAAGIPSQGPLSDVIALHQALAAGRMPPSHSPEPTVPTDPQSHLDAEPGQSQPHGLHLQQALSPQLGPSLAHAQGSQNGDEQHVAAATAAAADAAAAAAAAAAVVAQHQQTMAPQHSHIMHLMQGQLPGTVPTSVGMPPMSKYHPQFNDRMFMRNAPVDAAGPLPPSIFSDPLQQYRGMSLGLESLMPPRTGPGMVDGLGGPVEDEDEAANMHGGYHPLHRKDATQQLYES